MREFSYTITHLCDNSYLMPYGQAIADHRRTILTNEAGILLWNAFINGASKEELLLLLKDTYEASDDELPILEQDLNTFLQSLEKNNILQQPMNPQSGYPAAMLSIGPVRLCVYAPKALISTYFQPFVSPRIDSCCPRIDGCCQKIEDCCPKIDGCCQEIHILPYAPLTKPNGRILTRTMDLVIFETDNAYIYLPTRSNFVHEMHVSKDARTAYIYADMRTVNDRTLDELFHIMRFAFLMAAQSKDLLVVHSASILYNGRAYLFSGPSGAGKSTHTGLWVTGYEAPLLNGDLNMLGIKEQQVFCYGLPWCGTSGVCTNQTYPFGGITYLVQDLTNHAVVLPYEESVLQLTKRCINPCHTEQQLQKTFAIAADLCKKQPSYELYCTKEPEAAKVMKAMIDSYTS